MTRVLLVVACLSAVGLLLFLWKVVDEHADSIRPHIVWILIAAGFVLAAVYIFFSAAPFFIVMILMFLLLLEVI